MKKVICWAVYDVKTQEPFVYTVSRTRGEAIQKHTSGFDIWKEFVKEGYRVSKFYLTMVKNKS